MQGCANRRIAAPPLKLCRNNPRVVEDQTVALAQQLRQIAYRPVGKASITGNRQHPRRIAWHNRTKRNPLGRKLEIKKVNAHEKLGPVSFR